MTYTERKQDLFDMSKQYYMVHCISADFALGAGIARIFRDTLGMKSKLQMLHPNYLVKWKKSNSVSDCLLVDNVFNLVTKERAYHKPTYDSLTQSLKLLKSECLNRKITKLAMPTIGCGLDGLEWNKVSEIIKELFSDTNIEIVVCIL